MRKIFKYTLTAITNVIEMPENAIVLSCGLDKCGKICVWALVDANEDAKTATRNFYCVGTGWETGIVSRAYGNFFFPSKAPNASKENGDICKFLGSVKDNDGRIWHIFYGEQR